MNKDENQESEAEDESEEQDEHETETDERDATIQQLLETVERQQTEIDQLRSDLAEFAGRYDDHATKHHTEPERSEQLPEPEPVPDETHIWFKRIGKRT